MSQWKLPVIESKKQLGEEEDYNFVNKDKKKPKEQNGALSMVEELKRKVEEQKKEIENRNSTIMGLQRNFESLSGIVKHEKAQSALLKAELEKFRENCSDGDKRVTEFHEKLILAVNENKVLKEELETLKKRHSECYKVASQSEIYKSKISELETIIEKFSSKLDKLNQEKKILEVELNRMRGDEKVKRQLQERIIDLEDELKKANDSNNMMNDRLKLEEDKVESIKLGNAGFEAKISELSNKLREEQNKKSLVEFENDNLRRELQSLMKNNDMMKKNMDSIDIYSKIRQENEDKAKEEMENYKQIIEKQKQELISLQKENERKSNIIQADSTEISLLRKEVESMLQKEKLNEEKFNSELMRLTKLAGELNQQLDTSRNEAQEIHGLVKEERKLRTNLENKAESLDDELAELGEKLHAQQKYSKYFSQIDINEPKGVIILNTEDLEKMKTNETSMSEKMKSILEDNQNSMKELREDNERMKKYISSLEREVNEKTKEAYESLKVVREMELKLENFKNEENNLAHTIAEEKKKLQMFEKEYENQKIMSSKEIQAEREKSELYKAKLREYQEEEEKLKKLMAKEQEEIRHLSKNKEAEIQRIIQEKEQEIEKERKNNKLLWSDNKKLKEIEQKMRGEADLQLQEIENRKKQEIERLKRELEKKYGEEQMSLKKEEESNSNELKKILQEKAQQVKTITENHNKTKNELDFYKNRNKELEGVVSRTEKNFADQLSALEKELKVNKEVIGVLEKKNTEINLVKQEIERKQKDEIERLSNQLSLMKRRQEEQRIEEKIALIKKSISEFDTTLKAIGNSLSCNYCMEPVKECIRLKECGHLYCKKCKAGYQPNCGECKQSGQETQDKIIDVTVSKAEYMMILLNTVKEDLAKINT